jgi:predicted transcriptional regulator
MTIKTMLAKGVAACAVARLLGVSEGAVRYHARRMQAGAIDGRGLQPMKAGCRLNS